MIDVNVSAPSADGAGPGHDLQSCALRSRRVSKLTAAALLEEFAFTLERDRGTTVELLIQMGEIEARRLYVGLGHSSMYTYCTGPLRMCESTACRRIRAARVARRFPIVLPMLADGTLHLSAVSELAPHLTRQNAGALLAEAAHKSKAQVARLVARHFPRPDVATVVRPLDEALATASVATQVVANMTQSPPPVAVVPLILSGSAQPKEPLSVDPETLSLRQVMGQVVSAAAAGESAGPASESLVAQIADAVTQTLVHAAAGVGAEPGSTGGRLTPRAAGRFAWQLTADQEMQDLLEEAQQLMSHAEPRDLQAVLKRALQVLVACLRKSRFAATSQPREAKGLANGRHVPRSVVREVSERDGFQCTFRGPDGQRCTERMGLEFDHVVPFARGGKTTADNLRLLCRAHNQHEAERVYGETHMRVRREASRAGRNQARAVRAEAEVRAQRRRERAQDSSRDPGGNAQAQGAP